jgi:hypothetical protein
VGDLRGPAIDLRMMSYSFVILEEQGVQCEFAIDDVYWDAGVVSAASDEIIGRRASLSPNAPNPFNAMTVIRFELSETSPYVLTVFNSAGRHVKRFAGVGTAGQNTIRWNGRDDSGAEVASGVYSYRLEARGIAESRKMTLVK